MPDDNILTSLIRETLLVRNPTQPEARENYYRTASRVFRYVNDWLAAKNCPPAHWVDILLAPQVIVEFLDK